MDSYYMLIPVTTKKDNWKHKEKIKLSIDKAKEIQEFLMGRITEIGTKKNVETTDEDGNAITVKSGKILKCNSLQKRIINNFAIVEIDCELMLEYGDELKESCIDNECILLTHIEMLQYLKDNQEGL